MQRVLVVDDDEDIRALLCELLRLSGFRADRASSGIEALELLAAAGPRELPALVLLDVQMPELDGWDTLRRLRVDLGLVDVPVILCTVKASDADLDLGWSLGCDGYVAKPFGIAELVKEIHAVLDRTPDDRIRHRAEARAALAAH